MIKSKHMVSAALVSFALSSPAFAHENGVEHSALSPDHFALIVVVVLIVGLVGAALLGRGPFRSSRRD